MNRLSKSIYVLIFLRLDWFSESGSRHVWCGNYDDLPAWVSLPKTTLATKNETMSFTILSLSLDLWYCYEYILYIIYTPYGIILTYDIIIVYINLDIVIPYDNSTCGFSIWNIPDSFPTPIAIPWVFKDLRTGWWKNCSSSMDGHGILRIFHHIFPMVKCAPFSKRYDS